MRRRHSADDDGDARGSINVFAPSCHQLLIILSGSISGPVNSSSTSWTDPRGLLLARDLTMGGCSVARCHTCIDEQDVQYGAKVLGHLCDSRKSYIASVKSIQRAV